MKDNFLSKPLKAKPQSNFIEDRLPLCEDTLTSDFGSEDLLENSSSCLSDRDIVFNRRNFPIKKDSKTIQNLDRPNQINKTKEESANDSLCDETGTVDAMIDKIENSEQSRDKPDLARGERGETINITESKVLVNKRESQMEFERDPSSLLNMTPGVGPTPRETVDSRNDFGNLKNNVKSNFVLTNTAERESNIESRGTEPKVSDSYNPCRFGEVGISKAIRDHKTSMIGKDGVTPNLKEYSDLGEIKRDFMGFVKNSTTVQKKTTAASTQPNPRFHRGSMEHPHLNEISKIANLNIQIKHLAPERPRTLNQAPPKLESDTDHMQMDFLCNDDSEDGLDLDSQEESLDRPSMDLPRWNNNNNNNNLNNHNNLNPVDNNPNQKKISMISLAKNPGAFAERNMRGISFGNRGSMRIVRAQGNANVNAKNDRFYRSNRHCPVDFNNAFNAIRLGESFLYIYLLYIYFFLYIVMYIFVIYIFFIYCYVYIFLYIVMYIKWYIVVCLRGTSLF